MGSDELFVQTPEYKEKNKAPEFIRDREEAMFSSLEIENGKPVSIETVRKVPKFFSEADVEELDKSAYSKDLLDMDILVSSKDINRQYIAQDADRLLAMEREAADGIAPEELNAINQRRVKLAAIRSSYQLHTLSTGARLARNRVINGMQAKEQVKKQLLDSEESLDYVVKTFISAKEKKRAAKVAKGYLKHFWGLREGLAKDPLLSSKDKAKILYNYAKSVAYEIEVFKSLYLSELSKDKREIRLEEYIHRFEDLMYYFDTGQKQTQLLTVLGLTKSSANQEMFGKDTESVLEKARSKAKRIDRAAQMDIELEEEKDEEARREELDRNLTKEQLSGVSAADDWLIGLGTDSAKRLPFINKIMSLSARERLFIYRIMETGHLEAPNVLDVSISQTTYVPDVKKLSWKFYRIPFRLWEKMGADGLVKHHWEMLEAALAVINQKEVAGYLDSFVKSMGSGEEENQQGDRDYIDAESIEEEQLRGDVQDVNEAVRKRQELLDEAIKAVAECEEALKKRDGAWIHKKKKKKIAGEKTEAAQEALKKLMEADEEVQKTIDKARFNSGYTEEDTKGELMGHAKYATGQALGVMAKLSNIPKIFGKEIVTTSMIADMSGTTAMIGGVELERLLNAVNVTTGAFATLKGVMGLSAALKGTKQSFLAIMSGNISKTDAVFMAAQSLQGLYAGGMGTALGVTSMAYASRVTQSLMTNSTDAIMKMKKGTGYASKSMAAFGLAVNAADYAVQGKHVYHRLRAEKKIWDLKKSGELTGDKAAYMDGIRKLDTRNKVKKAADTTFSAVTNTGNLLAVTAGPVGSLAWAGISVGISLANKLTDYLMNERSHRKTAEEFMQMNKLDELFEGLDKGVIEKIKKDKTKLKELKTSLLNHMAAELGFVTFKTFFAHIIGKYAEYLFNNLFFDRGIPVTKENKSDHPMSGACYQMLKGMGLRVRYPKASDKKPPEKVRRPSKMMIAKKLGG